MVMSRDGRKNERRSRSVLRVRGRRFRAAAGRDGRVAGRCERVLLSFVAFWRVRSISELYFGVITQEKCPDADRMLTLTRYLGNHERHFLDVEFV